MGRTSSAVIRLTVPLEMYLSVVFRYYILFKHLRVYYDIFSYKFGQIKLQADQHIYLMCI